MQTGFLISSAYFSAAPLRTGFHHHSEYELIFVESGAVEVQVGRQTYLAKENDLILLSNLEQHSLRQVSPVYRRYCAILSTWETDTQLTNPVLLGLLKNHYEGFCHCISAAPIRATVISVFQKLIACGPEAPFANELAASYLVELLANLCRVHPELVQNLNRPKYDRIFAVQRDLDANYREPISISQLCKTHYISLHYLSHSFKAITGHSPKQYLTLLRLKHAARLLHDTALSIQEIAAESGFSDLSNFCKQFHREYGCTPSFYRNMSQKED